MFHVEHQQHLNSVIVPCGHNKLFRGMVYHLATMAEDRAFAMQGHLMSEGGVIVKTRLYLTTRMYVTIHESQIHLLETLTATLRTWYYE